MKKIFSIAVVFLLFLIPTSVMADGYILTSEAPSKGVGARESRQYAVIYYDGKTQYTFVSIKFISRANKSVWIYPVHANADDVEVDITRTSISFYGKDIKEDAKYRIANSYRAMIPSLLFSPNYIFTLYPPAVPACAGGGGDEAPLVFISNYVSEYGYTVEVVNGTGEGIYSHLASRGINLSKGEISQIDHYCRKGYSFVLAWFNGPRDYDVMPGIIIKHPAKRMYYPLILTSIYGSMKIPTDIVVYGIVTPNLYDEIKPYTKVKYYHGECYAVGIGSDENVNNLIKIMNSKSRIDYGFRYTYIHINAPANRFKHDLTMVKGTPPDISLANFIYSYYLVDTCTISFYTGAIVIAATSGLFWGRIIIGRKRSEVPYYMTLGVSSLLGLMVVIFVLPFLTWSRKWNDRDAILYAIAVMTSYVFGIVLQYFLLFIMMG